MVHGHHAVLVPTRLASGRCVARSITMVHARPFGQALSRLPREAVTRRGVSRIGCTVRAAIKEVDLQGFTCPQTGQPARRPPPYTLLNVETVMIRRRNGVERQQHDQSNSLIKAFSFRRLVVLVGNRLPRLQELPLSDTAGSELVLVLEHRPPPRYEQDMEWPEGEFNDLYKRIIIAVLPANQTARMDGRGIRPARPGLHSHLMSDLGRGRWTCRDGASLCISRRSWRTLGLERFRGHRKDLNTLSQRSSPNTWQVSQMSRGTHWMDPWKSLWDPKNPHLDGWSGRQSKKRKIGQDWKEWRTVLARMSNTA